jgi:hypothetical protein
LSDPLSVGDTGRKQRSFAEAAKLYEPIVPLPGSAAEIRPDPALDGLLPAADSQPVPIPPRSPVLVAPLALTPELKRRTLSGQASVPPSQEDAHASAEASPASPIRPRKPRLWPWAALLSLGIAGVGAGALWIHSSLQLAPVPQQPDLVAPPAPEAPAPPPAGTADTRPGTVPHTTSEPPSAAPPAALEPAVTEVPASPAAPQHGTTTAALPAPAEPSTVPEPALSATPPVQAYRRVVIYYRRASSAAGAEAARLAAELGPLAAQVDRRAATSIPRLPTIRYFHPEDAAAAQTLATALRRPAAAWRIQSVSPRRRLPPPRSFEVWLADR